MFDNDSSDVFQMIKIPYTRVNNIAIKNTITKTERGVLDLNQKAANELRHKMMKKTHHSTHMTAPELIFLGTGSAAPSTLRNSSSIYLNMNKKFLI